MSDTPSPETPEAGAAPAAKPKRKLVLIAGLAVVLLGGGGAGAWFAFGAGGDEAHAEAEAKAKPEGEPAYVEVPPMVVNLSSAEGRTRYLKARVTIEAESPEAAEAMKTKMPAINDAFQGLLHGIRPEDVSGSTGLYRLKEEMMVRVTRAAAPERPRDILIQELVLQ
ncbi:MAG: flagellar basal body-associated FliL family protein [Alphaproteobacteria bacterium]|nr:flagellar basal body-associated FliL family protein [Alphaproteobacteria bacterium]